MATLGNNQIFEIKNGDGTPFHNLVLRKSAVESIVMSLGDKISGDVYYKDNTLSVTMHEYITYNGVNYMLINPPTIVREGVVSDNSELRGMTKYSFVFYHPMCQLSNFPFTDVAVTNDETRYLSESKTFSWIGKPADFVAKMNKNLDGTEWIVEISSRFPQDKLNELSDVIPFDNATIADACKTFYDTWGVPYVVDKVASTEASYATGKRFKLVMGLPSNEIYENASAEQQNIPFVFQMGHGVGLKNNSRTPRNNKIITRISGYGSENNIPYGYPQVRWYGTAGQSFTYGDHAGVYTDVTIGGVHFDKVVSYPIYKGILNGEYVELIKHPFTRTHLMPSVYRTTLFNKISLYNDLGEVNTDYDPDITLVDYYDAIYSAQYPYPNTINLQAPSYESHEFEDEKPELGEAHIISATPLNNDLTPASSWDDSLDDEGNYKQSYFQMVLPQLPFDLYACASITEEMQINMRSGACLGCTFTVQVDWDDYKRNFYDEEGNFAPNGSQRDLTKYPKSNQGSISLVLQKDNSTFGTLMPNMYQYPKGETSSGAGDGDTFVILGISLPESYILAAEDRLDVDMKSYMLENNEHYFDYPLKFDEDFLFHNENILSQIRPNTVVRFNYAGQTQALFVKQITIKYGEQQLPQYDITLTDNVEVVLNQIGQVAEDVEKLSTLIAILRQSYGKNVWNELAKKLSKTQDDTAAGYITMLKGLQVGANFVPDILGEGGVLRMRDDGKVELVTDILYARVKAYFDSVEIREYQHTGGNRIASVAGNRICRVEYIKVVDNEETIVDDASEADFFRCYFRASDGEETVRNNWVVGDLAYCHVTSIVNSSDNPEQKGLNQKHLWRLVIGRNTDGTLTEDGEAYIDLSNRATETISGASHTGYQSGSDAPEAQDDIIQLGNVNDTTRQGAIVEFVTGTDAPSYQIYQGINSFSLNNKNQIGFGYNTSTGRAYLNVYGDAYIGARDRSTFIEYKQSGTGGNPELNIKAHVEFTNTDSELDTLVQAHQKTYDNAIAALIRETEDLQAQIDGAIESYFMEGEPSLTTPPVMNTQETHYEEAWLTGEETEEERIAILNKHIGDLYYDKETGHGYRFLYDDDTSDYVWAILTDEDVTEALRLASEAQETADGKSTTFLNNTSDQDESKRYPTNYKKGDTWILQVDATIGTTAYKAGDILTASADSETYSAAHWSKQVRYTDDTKADSILNNTYYKQLAGGTINRLIGTAKDAADAAQDAADAAQADATAANNKLTAWADDGKISPTEKLALKNQKDDVQKEYAQIITDAAKYSGVSTTAFTTAYNKAITAFNYYTSTDTENIDIITDEEEDSDATPRYSRIADYYAARQTILEAITTAAKSYATTQGNKFLNDAVYKAISAALGSKTDIVGGLVLTSLIGMRQQNEGGTYTVWGGISGEYDDWSGETHAKGHGIAAWYGGELLDKETLNTEQIAQGWDTLRWAKGVDRFDGSGYRANGNITWDEAGALTIKNITTLSDSNNNNILNELATFNSAFTFGTSGQGSTTALYITPNVPFQSLYVGTSNTNKKEVATQEWVGNNYVSTAFFRQLFRAFKPNATAGQADVEVEPNTIDATISNIKAMVGFWTEQYVSALGNNSDGGGGGAGVLYGLNDVSPNATGDGVLGAEDGYVLTYNGSTNHWYAAPTPETYVLPTATAAALGGIKIGYAASGKNYAIVLDANGKAYVNVPWTDTTYTLAGLMGSTAIGGATQPIYWDGSAFKKTTYTLAKSVPADAKFTDTTYSFSNADATLAWSTRTKIATTGGTDIYVTLPANPNTNTWRNIFLDGTEKLTTGINTKGLNFVGDGKTTISFLAAGTEEGQSGNANYATLKISSTWRGIQDNLTSDSTTDSLSAKQGKNLKTSITTLEGYFTNGVAKKAAQLNTSRTLWGQSFNGTANVSGNMTGVGNITMSANDGTYIKIGDIYIGYDSTNSAIEIYKLGDNNAHVAANLYAHGAISALGQGSDGGGGGQGDVTWDLLASSSDTRQIALSHLTTALSGYSPTSHTHTTTIAADSGTNQLTLAYGTKYKITAGGTSFVFTMPSADDTNTWRNIYVAGTQQITTAVNTKGLNFAAGNNVSLSFAAAGTGSGQSGNANYGTLTISATDTTYSAATQSAAGLMSADDKKKLDGIAANANNYSLPTASADTLGGVKVGATLAISSGVLNQKSGIATAGTYRSVTVDTYGRVTAGTNPTTLAGYGITDALQKLTYEYNKEIAFGTTGKLLIGKFPCYDSNVTIYLDSTTSTTYHATIILATQNINDSHGGSIHFNVYGDETNSVAPNLYLYYPSNSRYIEIYFSPSAWSKNIIHIKCSALNSAPTNICESVSEIPSNATTKPTNVLNASASVNYATSAGTASSCTGNSATATKLQTSRTINGTSFDGSANITTTNWGTARNISIADSDSTNTGTAVSVNGSAAVTLKLPSTIKATLSGNATTATTASKLSTVSKTAWGQTFWTSGGVPTSISGALSSVTNITMSGYIKIGDAYLSYDSTNNAIRVSANADGTGAVNFYAIGGVSALGQGEDGGGGGQGDVTWALLASQATGGRTIHSSYISGTLANYLPLSGGTMNNQAVISRAGDSVAWVNGRKTPIIKTTSYTGYNSILSMKTTNGSWDLGVYTDNKAYLTYITDANYNAGTNNTTYQLVFPQKNGTLAVTGDIPTNNNQLTNGAGYITSSSLNSYLPLSGGSSKPMTGTLYVGTGLGISDATGNALLCYKPTTWNGVSSSQWGVGTIDVQGVIRSSASNLVHYKGDTAYDILDSSNSSVSLSGSTLTVKINGTSKSLTNTNTTYSAGSGLSLSNTTFSVKTPSSGAWFSGTAYVESDGVMEVGRYIDFHPTSASTLDFNVRLDAGTGTTARTFTFADTAGTLLSSGNSSVSKSGETLTVKINGTSQSLTNTWRGIQDNLTSSTNTTESLSAKQGYLLANGSARDNTKIPLYRYGGTGSTTKIKININSTTSWMLCFVVTLYQGYRATKVMISGYQRGSNHWYQPEARLLGDSDGTETISVYFGYDSTNNLWVGFDGGSYTGVSINDVTNGYSQIDNFMNLFTISNVSSLATLQTTVTAASKANYANNADTTDGLHVHGGRNNEANKIVRTDGSGYIQCGWINTTSGNFTGTPDRIWASNDAYMRYMTPANFFPTLTNDSNQLSVTVGGQNRKLTIAYATTSGSCSGNAASATTLQTSRTIWGQSFNGSANVSGNMTGVGSITAAGTISVSHSSTADASVSVNNTAGIGKAVYLLAATNRGVYVQDKGWIITTDGNNTSVGIGDLIPANSVVPNSDNSKNLGSTSKYWQNVYHYNSCVWNHVNIGYQIGQITANRAELTIISSTDVPADIYIGSSNAKKWQMSSRASGDSYSFIWYANATTRVLSLTQTGNLTASGGVAALSDARHKQVIRDTNLSVEQIANMPSVIFKWTDGKHDNDLHVGTLAQSWQKVLPEVVLVGQDKEHTLSLSYGVAALVAAITTARKVVDHEKEIAQLKERVNALEKENELLKLKIA